MKVLVFVVMLAWGGIVGHTSIKVGIYQNGPMIFLNELAQPSGFFADLLKSIAQLEGWELEYVPCQWSDCLDALQAGNLDIMPDVAFTQARKSRFLFGKEPVITTWSVVYRHKEASVETLLDLDQKRVAVLKNTVQSEEVKMLIEKFDVAPRYIEVSDYRDAFRMLGTKEVDVVVTNRFYDTSKVAFPNVLVPTSIVMTPATMTFAFAKKHAHLATRMDARLQALKADKTSAYYQAKAQWLEAKRTEMMPTWLWWVLFGGALMIFGLSVLVAIFRKMVQRKSQQLLLQEEIMITQSRQAAMGEMIALIAHQWRQPLNIVGLSTSNLELLAQLNESITKQTLAKHIALVHTEVSHLSQTIDDFRDFFKPNKSKTRVKLSELLTIAQRIIKSSLENHQIALHVHTQHDDEVAVYQNEVVQVLINIINNAKDALLVKRSQGRLVEVRFRHDATFGFIEICDNAGGIDPSIMDQIGNRYFTTKEENGTGLGLYMSKIIINNHLGGALRWENRHEGACFMIGLPKDSHDSL